MSALHGNINGAAATYTKNATAIIPGSQA